jgi:DNA-binding LacI/PurR family transcriptional regulator
MTSYAQGIPPVKPHRRPIPRPISGAVEVTRYASSTDVARLAGVSQSAVSRTYKPGGSVSAETRRKVLEAAEALGYRPSLIPRIMLNHRSHLVAIVVGGMYNPFYAMVLEQFATRLQETGNQVLLVHVDSGYSLDEAIPKLASYRVDAVVSALAVLSAEAAAELARFRVPVVSFNTPVRNEWVSSVSCDNHGAGVAIADLFIARGARSFGYITGPAGSPANEDRFAGFRARLVEHGFSDLRIAAADFHYEAGFEAARAMLGQPEVPDAIFCANDLMAIGAIDAIRRGGRLRIPDDVMIAGFDGIPPASWGAYDLTTFEQDAPAMVERALEIVADSVSAHRSPGGTSTVIPARLVERASTRPPPGG